MTPLIKHFMMNINQKYHSTKMPLPNLRNLILDSPNTKEILNQLDLLHEKKNTLMQEYSSTKSDMSELYQIRKNYEKYMGKEMER